jgi:hypothetical protein
MTADAPRVNLADLNTGKDSTGLVAGHAYTLVSAKQTSKGDRLVKLRNPWGSMEWTGDWSDSSPLWTEEMQVRTFAVFITFRVVCVAVWLSAGAGGAAVCSAL